MRRWRVVQVTQGSAGEARMSRLGSAQQHTGPWSPLTSAGAVGRWGYRTTFTVRTIVSNGEPLPSETTSIIAASDAHAEAEGPDLGVVIVRPVPDTGRRTNQPGDREVRRQLRVSLNNNGLAPQSDIRDRDYAYIAGHH